MRSNKSIILAIVLIYSVSFAFAAESSLTSNFGVQGCVNSANQYIATDSCSSDGNYFCDSEGVLHVTTDADDDWNPDADDEGCCPSGYLYDGDVCVQRTEECSSYTGEGTDNDKNNCESANCFWVEETGGNDFCAATPQDYSCSVYTAQNFCEQDFLNLGRIGFGTEVCGDYFDETGEGNFVAPINGCGCQWSNDKCVLEYQIKEDIYAADDTAKSVNCHKSFDAGFCVEGEQEVSWFAGLIPGSATGFGTPATFQQGFAGDIQCVDGNDVRECGETIVRLPGFSNLALIASILLITLFYVFRRNDLE